MISKRLQLLLCLGLALAASPLSHAQQLELRTPAAQMYQILMQRLNPTQLAAGKTPDAAGWSPGPQSATAEPGSDTLDPPFSKRGSSSSSSKPAAPADGRSTGSLQSGSAQSSAGNSNSSSSGSSNTGGSTKTAAADSSGLASWPPAIRQLGNPSCMWLEADQACMPTQDNWLIPQGVPSSAYRRANLVAIARQRHCEGINQAAACWADRERRCYWHTSKTGKSDCRSADMLEVYFYSSNGFAGSLYDIPLAMTCPGSKAYEFFKCFAHPAAPDSCEKLGECFSVQQSPTRQERWQQQGGQQGSEVRSICLPRLMADMTNQDVDNFLAQLWSLDQRVFGNCPGACWMRQAQICRRLKVSSRGECETFSFCSYDRSKGMCLKRSLEFQNEFDFKVKRLYGICLDIDNAEDCKLGELTKPKPSLDWRGFTEQSEPVQCKLS